MSYWYIWIFLVIRWSYLVGKSLQHYFCYTKEKPGVMKTIIAIFAYLLIKSKNNESEKLINLFSYFYEKTRWIAFDAFKASGEMSQASLLWSSNIFWNKIWKVLKSILAIKKLIIQRSWVFLQVFAKTCYCLQITHGTKLLLSFFMVTFSIIWHIKYENMTQMNEY